jgi:hypothetical protein
MIHVPVSKVIQLMKAQSIKQLTSHIQVNFQKLSGDAIQFMPGVVNLTLGNTQKLVHYVHTVGSLGEDVVLENKEVVMVLWFLQCKEKDRQLNSSAFFIQRFSIYEHTRE